VTRRGLAEIALLAYPAAVRAASGEEMLATLLDASAGSRVRLARELADLVRLGLRLRAVATARAGAGRLVADGVCLAAVWVLALDLATLLAQRERGMHDALLAWPSIALLAAVLALALVGFERLAGAGALAWTALRLPELLGTHPGVTGVAPEVLPAVCFVVMVLAPRARPVDVRRLAWLAVPAALALVLGPRGNGENPMLLALVVLAALVVVTAALALLPTDPRMAIAGAVPVSSVALAAASVHHDGSAIVVLAVAAAPAAVAVAVGRTRRLRRIAPL